MTVHQGERDQGGNVNSYGDRDGDGDVDSTDKGTPGTTCTGTVSGTCRILDLDFDGDYDSNDATLFDSLPQGLAIHPGRFATGLDQPFSHQGLWYEPEIGSYQNRLRQYDPGTRRFIQRDPLAEGPGPDDNPDRVNVYEVMAKPVICVDPEMDIRYCARMFERFGLSRAPVIEQRKVVGIVSYTDMVLRGLVIKKDYHPE